LPLRWQNSFSIHEQLTAPIRAKAGLYGVSTATDSKAETYVEVGYFTGSHGDHKDYYMVVNRRTDAARTITLTFQKQANADYQVKNEFTGEKRFYSLDKKGRFQYKVFLKEGEGVLIYVNGANN